MTTNPQSKPVVFMGSSSEESDIAFDVDRNGGQRCADLAPYE
jgi:hypothetical protein